MMKTTLAAFSLAFVATLSTAAHAENSKCWGLGTDDKSRPDISCRELTEAFLLSMRGATRTQVLAAMNAGGRPVDGGLHFISNYGMGSRGFSGDANFRFDGNDRVNLITGSIDQAGGASNMEFIWNAEKGFLCSDLPGSRARCNSAK
jgi:hypothetical protein